MELAYDLIKSEIRIIGEMGIYPEKDNCFHIMIESDAGKYEINYCPKPVYNMIMVLKALESKLNEPEIKVIIEAFNKFGEYKYNEASNDYSMMDAGADL